jgi:hypothetical protein
MEVRRNAPIVNLSEWEKGACRSEIRENSDERAHAVEIVRRPETNESLEVESRTG